MPPKYVIGKRFANHLLPAGGGPSSLLLAYILHGHIPYYVGGHRDSILDAKLRKLPNLLYITPETWSHFAGNMRYATHVLPLNVLLDTLVRPDADTQISPESCIDWRYEPEKAISHVVLGSAQRTGGVWTGSTDSAVEDIGTLSYAEMLSLPGYTYADHHLRTHRKPMPELDRPSRRETAAYYAAYPSAVGISNTINMLSLVSSISREREGFRIQPENIRCKNLVLATGIFDHILAPSVPISLVAKCNAQDQPLLVIGSGYSAADAIISCPPCRKIVHIYRWGPINKPSPLKGCHHQAYPEYAGVYRQMKAAALKNPCNAHVASPLFKKKGNPFFRQRDWDTLYQGFPNAKVESVALEGLCARIQIRREDGRVEHRVVGGLEYLVGRRGSLSYLDTTLLSEVLPEDTIGAISSNAEILVSSRTLRHKAERDTEVAPAVFIIGSLTGDSLVRHAFGSCVHAASRVLGLSERWTATADLNRNYQHLSRMIKAQNHLNGTMAHDVHG
jgi:Pyridine nucleotide-disulphide oxidoreductase